MTQSDIESIRCLGHRIDNTAAIVRLVAAAADDGPLHVCPALIGIASTLEDVAFHIEDILSSGRPS